MKTLNLRRKRVCYHKDSNATESSKTWGTGEPVTEKTLLGWTVMSPGREDVGSPILLTQSTSSDYEQLCTLDVLGLSDVHADDQQMVYEEFKEQLERNPAGWYETKLPWKTNQPDLPTNEAGRIRRLEQFIRKLHRDGQYEEYDNILQEQLQQGIIEPVPDVRFVEKSSTSHTRESIEWMQKVPNSESFMIPPQEKGATSHPQTTA